MEVPNGPGVFQGSLWPVHRRAQRPDVPLAAGLLLVERPVLALRHHPNAQGNGERPAQLSPGTHLTDRLC